MEGPAAELSTVETWPTRWNARMAFSAFVHLLHCLAIFVLILFVPAPPGRYMLWIWAGAAFISAITLLLIMRVGSYEGITDAELGKLIRRGYWTATITYLCLLLVSVAYLFLRAKPASLGG